MMKQQTVAVITGATGGIGREFLRQLLSFGDFDRVLLLSRKAEDTDFSKDAPVPYDTLSVDFGNRSELSKYEFYLSEGQMRVGLLINCSGFGKFGATAEVSLETNCNMVDVNCIGVLAMCQMTLPYMERGAKIVNVASVAGEQPIPYINVYAATKAFVLSFSRGLAKEVKSRGITVTAVCPFWTKTGFFDRAVNKERRAVVKKYVAMYEPRDIVTRCADVVKRGGDVCRFGFKARGQSLLCKILPHRFVMWAWMKQQKLS